MATAADRLLDAVLKKVKDSGLLWSGILMGTVSAIGSDGTVTVARGADTYPKVRLLSGYRNPAVSDTVEIMRALGGWICLGATQTATDGAWVSYTPTWTAVTTNPALGNGTLIGRYSKIGRTVHVHINLTTGSTTTYGSGNYSFALPFPAANQGCTYIGNAHLLQTSRYTGQLIISPGSASAGPSFPDSAAAPVTLNALWNQTKPLTFASGGQMRITATYESAS